MYTINESMLKFGELMLDELGLYAEPDGLVCDQEDGNPISMNGKNLIYAANPEVTIKRNEMLFDPLNNPALGKYLFGFYASHRADMEISGFHNIPDIVNKNKGVIRIESNNDIVAESGSYYSDSVKYADVIMRLNGDDRPNLSTFDFQKPVSKKRR